MSRRHFGSSARFPLGLVVALLIRGGGGLILSSASPRWRCSCAISMAKALIAWKPIQVRTDVVISGGHMRKPQVLAVERFEHEGSSVDFVPIGSSETWLCEAVTGQVSSRRPLSRSEIFGILHRNCPSEVQLPSTSDRMADLHFQESPTKKHDSPEPDSQGGKRRRVRGFAKYKGALVWGQDVPDRPSGSSAAAGSIDGGVAAVAADQHVLLASKGKKSYIQLNAVPWLVAYIAAEFSYGFVAPIAETPAELEDTSCDGPKIWWDFRDDLWVGRVVGSSGKSRPRRSKGVHTRMKEGADLFGMTFNEAKKVCYDELFAGLSDPVALADACSPDSVDDEAATPKA